MKINGKQVSKKVFNTSTYMSTPTVYRVGTKKAEDKKDDKKDKKKDSKETTAQKLSLIHIYICERLENAHFYDNGQLLLSENPQIIKITTQSLDQQKLEQLTNLSLIHIFIYCFF